MIHVNCFLAPAICFWLSVCVSLCQTNRVAGAGDNLPDYYRQVYAATTWGQSTNSIQFGARLSSIGPSSSDKFKVFTSLCHVGLSNTQSLWVVPHGFRLDISLEDEDGKSLKRTKAGDDLCKPLFDAARKQGRALFLYPHKPEKYDNHFDIRECFNVKKSGQYVLTVKPRLFQIATNSAYAPFHFPEVKLSVQLSEDDLVK